MIYRRKWWGNEKAREMLDYVYGEFDQAIREGNKERMVKVSLYDDVPGELDTMTRADLLTAFADTISPRFDEHKVDFSGEGVKITPWYYMRKERSHVGD